MVHAPLSTVRDYFRNLSTFQKDDPKMQRKWAARILFCLSLLVMFASKSLAARGMWGSKRKRDEDEDVDDISGGVGSGFETRGKVVSASKQAKATNLDGFDALTTSEGGMGESIESMINMYLNMMEELVESPEFETLITPDAITAMLDQIPGLSDNPEVGAMLDSPALKDPAVLKQTILQGMQAIRSHSSEIIEFFNSPEKIRQVLQELPEEIKGPVNAMMQGDMSGIRDILSNIPGLGAGQQDMLMNLLDGNMDALASSAKKIMSDPDQTEAARQQFLSNPGMAEMFGISEDVINDKSKFEALMADGMDSLLAGGANKETEESVAKGKGRMYKGASMSA